MPYLPWMTPEAKKVEEGINPYLSALEPALETAKTLVKEPWGAGEAALNLATQTYGLPLTGFAGLAGLPFGKSQEWSDIAQRATIYEPKTEAGHKILGTASLPFEMLGRASEKVADWAREKTGSPLAATVAGTGIQALPILFGARSMMRKTKTAPQYPAVPKDVVTRMKPVPKEVERPTIPSTPRYPLTEAPVMIEEANPYLSLIEKVVPEEIKAKRAELFDVRGGVPELESARKMLEPLKQRNVLTEPQKQVNIPAKNIMEASELAQEVHYMPPSEWMKVPELNRDALSVSKRVGIAPENLEYVGLQKFTPLSQDAMHLWNVVDKGSELFGSTVAGPKFQLSKGKSKSLLKSEEGSLQLGTPVEQPAPPQIIASNTYRGQRKTSLFGPDDGMLVAKNPKGEDIGYLWYTKKPEGFTVNKVEVAKANQRQGVATSLLQQAESEMGPSLGATTAQTPEGMAFQKGRKSILKGERGSLGEPGPVWHSALQRTIEQKMPNQAPVEQVRSMISGAGVKADEMKWSGLDEYLQGKTGKVNKAELVDYLKQNQVEITEVVKGQPSPMGHDMQGRPIYPYPYQSGEGTTKFSQWQLPGGENYKELLLQLPEKQPSLAYRGSHWDEPNVLAHVRFNDRVDAQGKKVLFIEEIQSDWHQAGREKGYKGEVEAKRKEFVDFLKSKGVEVGREPEIRISGKILEDAGASPDLLNRWYDYIKSIKGEAVPSAPFSKTWHEMTMRRMVRQASEQGYDKIAWTTGEQQAARYDLSKQVSRVEYWPRSQQLMAYDLEGSNVLDKSPVSPAKIQDYIGKEAAKKILEAESRKISQISDIRKQVISGLDLKVGGEGMRGFYDKIIPDYMNKFGKRWGAKVGETTVSTNPSKIYATYAKGDGTYQIQDMRTNKVLPEIYKTLEETWNRIAQLDPSTSSIIHSLDITPSMRESALKEGFPLFQLVPPVVAGAGLVGERLTRKK